MNGDLFSNVGTDCWNRPLIVDAYDGSFVQTVRVPVHPGNIPIIDRSKYTDAVDQDSKNRCF